MKFTKTNDIYKIVRITGGYDNILGVCFTQKDNEPLEIIEWDLKNTETIKTSRSEIQSQVISGLRLVNPVAFCFFMAFRVACIVFLFVPLLGFFVL